MYFLFIKTKSISTTQQKLPELGNSTEFHTISIHLVGMCFEQNLKVPLFGSLRWHLKKLLKK